jgi:hypothetical protein
MGSINNIIGPNAWADPVDSPSDAIRTMTPDFTGRMLVPLLRLEERKVTVYLHASTSCGNVGVDCYQGGQ